MENGSKGLKFAKSVFFPDSRHNSKKKKVLQQSSKIFGKKIFKRASRKIHQRSHRFYIWNRTVIMWRKFVQKERKNRNTISEIIMDMGKYFPCKWGKKRLLQESFEKNPPEVTQNLKNIKNTIFEISTDV
jgi:hypothetical protein